MAKVSLVVPFHWMDDWPFFLTRCLKSIENQTFRDYEVILTKAGDMPTNTNRALMAAKGELVKILFMDDYFASKDSLEKIVANFKDETHWLVTACGHDTGDGVIHSHHIPHWTNDIITGNNGIGSPSVLTMRRTSMELFDESLSWLLDCDLYQRLYMKHGLPTILALPNVVIGIGQHQTTYQLTDERKQKEHEYLLKKYAKS